MQNKIIGIPANNLSLGTNLFISIYKTLNSNGYKCYFINPNKIVKHTLDKLKIEYLQLTQYEKKYLNYIKKYKNKNNIFFIEHVKILKIYFGSFLYKYILEQYLKDYSESKYLIKKYKINTLLIHNGYYQITRTLAKDLGIEIIYFENGYFGNDIQIDNKGINANISFANDNFTNILKIEKKIGKITNIEIEYGNNKIKFINYLYLGFISVSLISGIIFLKYILKKKYEEIKRALITNIIKSVSLKEGKYIIIGFQVHDDTQIIFNSPIINKMDDILNFYYKTLKQVFPDYKIIVKEHPMDIGRVNYYHLQKKYPDIIWIKKGNIMDYIEKSDYMICVNSSIGLQALSRYKKVITLGNNFYSNNPWVVNIKNKNNFKKELLKLKEININKKEKEKIDKYIKTFQNNIFINGSWYNFKKRTIKEICNYIINI